MKGAFSTPICKKSDKWPTKAFLQAAATATMPYQAERWTHPPPLIPTFLLAQNLSSKRIAPTDNIQQIFDNTKGE